MADYEALAKLLAEFPPERNPAHPPEAWNRGVRNIVSALVGGLGDAVTFPGRYARGETGYVPGQMASEQPAATQWAPEMALNMFGTGTPFAQAGAAGIFGGRLAKTADQAALARAEEMATKGAPREQIWNDTGWFQGKDGQWRFEIPDNSASVAPGQGGYWKDHVDHPEFFNAYPHTNNLQANINYGDLNGSFWGDGMSVTAPSRSDMSSVALHEMQHAVQKKEGFALGGNPANFTQGKDAETARAVLSWRRELDRLPKGMDNSAKENAVIQQYQELGAMDWVPSREIRDLALNRHTNPDDQLEALVKLYELDQKTTPSPPMEMYRRTAGEVEARNVQARQDMTPEERRAKPPWLTEDVPPLRQILIRAFE